MSGHPGAAKTTVDHRESQYTVYTKRHKEKTQKADIYAADATPSHSPRSHISTSDKDFHENTQKYEEYTN